MEFTENFKIVIQRHLQTRNSKDISNIEIQRNSQHLNLKDRNSSLEIEIKKRNTEIERTSQHRISTEYFQIQIGRALQQLNFKGTRNSDDYMFIQTNFKGKLNIAIEKHFQTSKVV